MKNAFSLSLNLFLRNKYKVVVAMLHDENLLFNFDIVNIHRNIMTNTDRTMTSQIGVGFRFVFVDPPANFSVDGEFRAFANTSGHHVELRAIVQKRIHIDFMIEDNFRTTRRICIKLIEITGVDVCAENRRHIRSINRRWNEGQFQYLPMFFYLILQSNVPI